MYCDVPLVLARPGDCPPPRVTRSRQAASQCPCEIGTEGISVRCFVVLEDPLVHMCRRVTVTAVWREEGKRV